MMEIILDSKGLNQVKNILRATPHIIAAALNDTAREMKTDATREIRVHYNVKAGPVRKGLRLIRRATPKLLKTGIKTKGKALSLIHFGVYPSKPVSEGGNRPKVGVGVRIKKGGSRRKMKGMFVARRRDTGKLAVMKRTGRTRLPVWEKWGPGIPKMLQTKDVTTRVRKKAVARLNKNVERQVRHEAAKAGVK